MLSKPTRTSIVIIVSGVIVVLAGVIALFSQRNSATSAGRNRTLEVTRYPTITPFPLFLPTATSRGPEPTVGIVPTVAPRLTEYTVQQNDTLWDIAVRFGLTFDAIKAANSGTGFNPDALSLGQVIKIPPSDFVPPPGSIPTAAPALPQVLPNQPNNTIGVVLPEAGGLRLRKTPSTDGEVLTRLGPNTQLQIVSEAAGQTWIEVITQNGTRGWVMAQYIAIGGASNVPAVPSSPGDLPVNNPTPIPIPVGPLDYPFLSDMSARVYQIYQAGQARGNRANVVALIGDSNTQHPAFMKPFDWGNYNLGSYTYLQATADFFKGSFAREGVAAIGGFNTTKMLDPGSAPSSCGGQSPLQCEYNAIRPSVALILLGTGDQHTWQGFEDRYRQIIQQSIDQGIIPVLITKADDLECRDNSAPCGFINSKIAQLAGEYQVPLLNLRQVVERLPGGGCISDGFHYNFPADNKSAWFASEYLQYGYNQRNLTALQTLDVIRRKVMGR